MDTVVKFNSQTAGRDRLFRLLQYGSRLIWAYLEKYSHDKDTINKLKNLEYSLSTARKLFRIGRSLDHFYSALSTINLHNPTLRLTLTLSKINTALFLMADHILWMGRVGLIEVNKSKWSRVSYKFWLYYLIMNLTRDLYEIMHIIRFRTHDRLLSVKNEIRPRSHDITANCNTVCDLMIQHKDITIDTIKNGCDIWIPLSLLGYVSLSPGLIGFLGVVSSIAAIIPIVDPSCKLVPN